MKFLRSRLAPASFAALACAVGASPAHSQNEDVLVFSASQTLTHESNLLRLPEWIPPEAVTNGAISSRSDTISTTTAGVTFDRLFSLQRIKADAAVNRSRYSNYKSLDYTGYDVGASWDWAYGRQWYGVASFRANRSLASFDDIRSGARNILDQETVRFQGGYRFTPSWSVVAALDSFKRENSAQEYQGLDSQVSGIEAGARWTPLSGADWQFLWRRSDGEHPNRQVRDALGNLLPVTIDNAYTEDRVFTRLGIEPSDKTRFQGDIGYTRRRFENLSQRDFGGLTFALGYTWRGTDLMSVSAYARRDLGGTDELTSSYVETRVMGVQSALQLTGRTTVTAAAEHRRLDYTGDPGFVLFPFDTRQDSQRSLSAALSYEVSRKIFVTAQVRWERRNSNFDAFNFRGRTVGVTGEIQF
jgi:exopolysaccharide biosynthesis operon protein EpsL